MEFIATRKRLQGLLTSVSEELDTPLYYTLSDICRTLHCNSPPLRTLKAALINAGYEVSGYHKEPEAIKTTAPSDVLWDILRAWIKEHPLQKPPPENSAVAKILAKEPSITVDFTIPTSMKKAESREKVTRFPLNPDKYWGPKRKASGHTGGESAMKRKAEEAANGDESLDKQPETKKVATEETTE